MEKNKKKDLSSDNKKYIISTEIIVQQSLKKNGKPTGYEDMYIRRSIQDYYIKFCESGVSRQDLEKQLSLSNNFIKTLNLEIEFRDGLWDVCDENDMSQSRLGEYVIIHRIIKD